MGVSNMTLVKIASIGGMATVTMGMLFQSKIQENIRSTPYYKEALATTRKNKAAVHLLGEPMKEKRIDLSKENNNFTKEATARYEVPIKGPKQGGVIFFWASKENEKWNVDRIELQIDNVPDKRVLIKNSGKSDQIYT